VARPENTSFLAFFLRWSKVQGWAVPPLHIRMCHWLDTCTESERVMMVFRGAAKSTIYAVYKAYRLWKNRRHRSLVWSADGSTAGMLTADVINVLRNHPWCGGMLPPRPGAKRFWVNGANDARNASMRANGVDSNATGARADAIDFDDIEVPGNIETPEARLKLRQRISESTHIAVPGSQKTYIGTPHTHESIYPERIAGGAAVLKIPLFEHVVRFVKTNERTRYPFHHPVGADGLYVMAGIHKGARLLVPGTDYVFNGREVVFAKPPGVVLDLASMCAWPERFTRNEIELRRKETRTLNAWDSQYQLEAKPLNEVRLDPERIQAYDCEPVFRTQNKRLTMWLGQVQIVGCSLRWDPSSGKTNSDVSAAVLDLQDATGRHYWHRVEALTGSIADTSEDGKRITGGQVYQLCDLIETFKLSRVTVETNGIGGYAPAYLRQALKQRRLRCGVGEIQAVTNKNKRILEAIEPPLTSGMLWAHVSVIDGPLFNQMRDWNAALANQPDDFLDAGAGAITDQPSRVGQLVGNPTPLHDDDWRPTTGVFEATLEA
jgi:hypothetical protein